MKLHAVRHATLLCRTILVGPRSSDCLLHQTKLKHEWQKHLVAQWTKEKTSILSYKYMYLIHSVCSAFQIDSWVKDHAWMTIQRVSGPFDTVWLRPYPPLASSPGFTQCPTLKSWVESGDEATSTWHTHLWHDRYTEVDGKYPIPWDN